MNPDIHRARRDRLARQMNAQGGGVAFVQTGAEVRRNRDSEYPYRWDSYFHYLTGFPEPEAALVLVSGARPRSILFCRPKNEEREIWDGWRVGPDAARERFGFDEAYPVELLDEKMAALLADRLAIHYPLGADAALDARVQRWLGAVRAQARAGVSAPSRAVDVCAALDELRLVKDEHELDVMRRAARISAAAHVRAMREARPGRLEYEIEAELLHEFRRNGSQFPAYGSIVASGPNACVLHYRENDRRMQAGELLLIDAGCELDGYASDITRTFPVDGRFSGPQRALYDVVLDAQRAAIEATRPGATFMAPHDAAVRVLAQGLVDCGLLAGSVDGAIESGAYRRFYMHRTGHWLGMDVHDCGDYREPTPNAAEAPEAAPSDAAQTAGTAPDGPADPDAGPAEKPWRVLRPGMVLTIEPGLYVRAAADVDARFHDIGIRIEDDAVVHAEGCEILTHDVPKHAEDIEALMRDRAR